MIDLHCHSHFSDGMLSPKDLLEKALAANLRLLALTDHDTLQGSYALQELQQSSAHSHSLTLINGIEFSTRWKKYDIHILGLHFSLGSKAMDDLIKKQQDQRLQRAYQISERLSLLGVDNAYEKACTIAGHEYVARPHFAKVLVEEGRAADMTMAFKRFLGRGKPAYYPTPWISIPEAIEGIHAAGGQAVMAHPLKYMLTRTKLHELIMEFKMAGGDALEVVSGEMTQTEIDEMAGLTMRFDLLASSGSDYHGDAISRISLGQQKKLPLKCIPIWNQWNLEQGTL